MKLEIWHNILWSRYKGIVFSQVNRICRERGIDVHFVQAAESDSSRQALSDVDLSYHEYPFELLYKGSLDQASGLIPAAYFFWRGLTTKADFVIIAGYAEARNWAQLLGLMLSGTRRGVFCDSTLYESSPERWRGWAKRRFFGRCDLIFCYGERASAMAAHFGAPPQRLVRRCQAAALPHGYDAAAVPAKRAAAADPAPRFLYVGRFSEEKNLDRLIEAFALVHRDLPAAQLRLAGAGALRERLEAAAAAAGLSDAVVFTGGISPDRLAQEYLAATALVLPSMKEPWGLVVNEALSYGCPVLVSERCGCVPELAIAGQTGVCFDPLDVPAMAAGMRALNREYRGAATTSACLVVIAKYTPQAAATDIVDGIGVFFARREGRHVEG